MKKKQNKQRKNKIHNPRAQAHSQNPYYQPKTFNKVMANTVAKPNDLCSPAMKQIVRSMTTVSVDGPAPVWAKPRHEFWNSGTSVAETDRIFEMNNLLAGRPVVSRTTVQMMPNATGFSWLVLNTALIGNSQDAIFSTNASYTGGGTCPNTSKTGDTTTALNRYQAIDNDVYGQHGSDRPHGFIPTRVTVRLVNQDDAVSSRQGYLHSVTLSTMHNSSYITDTVMKRNTRVLHQDANVLDSDDSPIITVPLFPMINYHGNVHDYVTGFNFVAVGQRLVLLGENISGNLNLEVTVAGFYVGFEVNPETIISYDEDAYWCALTCVAKKLVTKPSDEGTRSTDIQEVFDEAESMSLRRQSGSATWLQAGMGALTKGASWAVRALLESYGL